MKRITVVAATTLLVLGTFACSIDEEPTAPVMEPSLSESPDQPRRTRLDWDDRLALVAVDAPGFAGFHIENERIVVTYVPGRSSVDQIREAFRDYLVRQTEGQHPDVVNARLAELGEAEFRPSARYDYSELHRWYRMAQARLYKDEVRSTDLNERDNEIRIGLADPALFDEVRARITALGVDPEALVLFDASNKNLVPSANLRSTVRPMTGGVQIENEFDVYCSLGFSLLQSRFVTTSHCTNYLLRLDGVDTDHEMGQPTQSSIIGVELADPPTFTNSADTLCLPGNTCRYADVAMFSYTGGSHTFGTVAWPSGSANTAWDTLATPVLSFTEYKHIGGEIDPPIGTQVWLIGQRMGFTTGEVLWTCENATWTESGVTMQVLCATVADYPAWRGDSGGTVIDWVPPASRPYYAGGVHFAVDWAAQESYFSPTSKWQEEMNDEYSADYCLSIYCTPDPSVQIDSGPTVLPSGLLCEWTAWATGGVPPYTYEWTGVDTGSGTTLDGIIYSSGVLYVTVTDAVGHTDSDNIYITIDNGAPVPPGCQE